MDAADFRRLLSADHYSPADLEQVNRLCRNYPVFGLAHQLRVRIMEALSYEKAAALKLAAAYSPDRKRLFEHVNAVHSPADDVEVSAPPEAGEDINFGEGNSEEAEIIIGQHAPYAAPAADETLLELEEDEAFVLDDAPEVGEQVEPEPNGEARLDAEMDEDQGMDDLHSETLIEAVAKDEVEMEEAGTEVETPSPAQDRFVEKEEELASPGDEGHEEEQSVVSADRRLILNFIQEDPGPIRADKQSRTKGDVSLSSIREHDGFITDTLAKIYVKQRLYAKAIYAYEKLSLKYPEKSAYFAAQIEKIRNLNRS
jgi:hypothetical protein